MDRKLRAVSRQRVDARISPRDRTDTGPHGRGEKSAMRQSTRPSGCPDFCSAIERSDVRRLCAVSEPRSGEIIVSIAAGHGRGTRAPRGIARYMELVAQFPLRPLRSERDLDRATRILNELAIRGICRGQPHHHRL
jgi:hypothetical protein